MTYFWGQYAWTQVFIQQFIPDFVYIQIVDLRYLIRCHMDICITRQRQYVYKLYYFAQRLWTSFFFSAGHLPG